MISVLFTACLIVGCFADDKLTDQIQTVSPNVEEASQDKKFTDIKKNVNKLVQYVELTEKSMKDGVLSEHVEELYTKLTEIVKNLIKLLQASHQLQNYFNNNKIDKIIISTFSFNYEPLKEQILILIKTLFNIDPHATTEMLPLSVIDELLYIFENNDNVDIKSYTIDIMCKWLPKNPKIQAHVMKVKGLEPFYYQTLKLDTSEVGKLLDLFNNILEEHFTVRNKPQKENEYWKTRKIYENIGLIERISTPTVCNGLMNVFEVIIKRNDFQIDPPIFHLLKNIKPFCLRIFRRKFQAEKVLQAINTHLKNLNIADSLTSAEVQDLLDEYIYDIKIRDEF